MNVNTFSFSVQWHLTEKCNLQCQYCYPQESGSEMTFRQICRALDNIREALDSWTLEYEVKIQPKLVFTGGEPMLRRDLFDILEYARSSDFSLALVTNGTLVDSNTAARIIRSQVDEVHISLDGLQSVHDTLRGRGSFRSAVWGIKSLTAAGLDTRINLTVSRVNIEQITGLATLAKKLNVGAVNVSRTIPCGRGQEVMKEVMPPLMVSELYRNLASFNEKGINVISHDPLSTVAGMSAMDKQMLDAEFPLSGCGAGVFGITIAANGDVMPCQQMNIHIGNIKDVSFRELWMSSPVLRALRNRQAYHGGCQSCRFWAICRGCRAVALAFSRAHGEEDYLGPDPECPYYQVHERVYHQTLFSNIC